MESFLFYLFCTLTLFSGLVVVLINNPVNAVFYLVLAFCNATGLLLLCEIEFLAFLFLIVYVGAIAVLFLFVIIILNLKENFYNVYSPKFIELYKYIPIGFFIGLVFIMEIFSIFNNDFICFQGNSYGGYAEPTYTEWVFQIDSITNLGVFGHVLYTFYFYFFLVSGFILLVSIISAIVLTSRKKVDFIKKQHVYQQISRNVDYAVFLVKRK